MGVPKGCPHDCYSCQMPAKKGTPSLSESHPELSKQWDHSRNPDGPTRYTRGSEKRVWWLCDEGHSWEAKILNRAVAGQGCPYCSGREAIPGETDAATLHPEWVEEIDSSKNAPEVLSNLKPSSHKRIWFLCDLGHSYEQPLSDRKAGQRCGVCAGKVVISGVNDLGTVAPELLEGWDYEKNAPLLPSQFTANSGKSFFWTCAEGHTQRKTPTKRASSGCSICGGTQLLPGFNDLETLHPRIAAEWDESKNTLRPSEVGKSSRERVWWRCTNGHTWEAQVYSRQLSGCPSCAVSGFDQTKPGMIYFLENIGLDSMKVGITNVDASEDRVRHFENRGWSLIWRGSHGVGLTVLSAETEFFRWLRNDLGIPQHLDKPTMGTSGYTETFSGQALSKEVVVAKLEQLLRAYS